MKNFKSIPYLGTENNNIIEYVLNKKLDSKIETNLYDLINNKDIHSMLVVINGKWLVWLDDIRCNYRDKKCYIPYWKYDIIPLDKNLVKRDIFQYLICKDDTFYLRYNYTYEELKIELGTDIVIYNTKTEKKNSFKIKEYLNEKEWSIEKLYKLYIDSSYYDENLLEYKDKGRYFIDKFSTKLGNRELRLRSNLALNTFKNNNHLDKDKDYRDVRNYKLEEIYIKYGMIDSTENYKSRRLKFDSYLYCIMRSNKNCSNKEFNNKFTKLSTDTDIIKYGDKLKLIFKGYWKNDINIKNNKTWLRAEIQH